MPKRDRAAYMREYRAARRKAITKRRCVVCGHWFQPVRVSATYCSDVCRQRAYRKRQRDK